MTERIRREAARQARWEDEGVFRVPTGDDARELYVSFDSAPFANGDLHLGHARNYVLGDVDARFHRLIGRRVLHTTNFDAFGLPIVLEAEKEGVTPADMSKCSVRRMTRDLRGLGLSYDWGRVQSTTSAGMIRKTQQLFLRMLQAGVITRASSPVNWCPGCRSVLAAMQVDDGCCGRCGSAVSRESRRQWIVRIAEATPDLCAGLDCLDEWSGRARNILTGFAGVQPNGSHAVHDWVVSRQRSFGTPVPVLYCRRCGHRPVPPERLPFLPERPGQDTGCPSCGGPACPDPDRLDCVFDDVWCFLAWDPDAEPFERGAAADPSNPASRGHPLDIFHAGYDTFIYPWLYRFVARFLHAEGLLASPEPIRRFHGHDMILNGGAKMGKSLDNAVSVRGLLDREGADVLRASMILAARPDRPVDWSESILDRGRWAVTLIERWIDGVTGSGDGAPPSSKTVASPDEARRVMEKARSFYAEYRPHAAFELLLNGLDKLEGDPAAALAHLAPVVPHLAEEGRMRIRDLSAQLDVAAVRD